MISIQVCQLTSAEAEHAEMMSLKTHVCSVGMARGYGEPEKVRTWGHWVPDADVREELGLQHVDVRALERWHILCGRVQQQVLQILSVAAQPVLQALHKIARVLRLLARQKFQHRRQRAHLRAARDTSA